MKKLVYCIFSIILFLSFSSCASLMSNMAGGLADSLYEQNDVQLVKEGAPAFLLLVEGFVNDNKKSRDMLKNGIMIFSAYSGAFVQEPERRKIFNKKTKTWAIDLLKTYKKFEKYYEIDPQDKEGKDEALKVFLSSVKEKDIDYVFWAAYSWALAIMDDLDSMDSFIELPIAKSLIDRVYELDSGFYYGAPHLFYGIFYGAYPEAFGGDLTKAQEEFEKALEYSEGKLLMTKLFYADFYFKPKLDKEGYVQIMNEVIETDVDLHPETRLMNLIAQEQAKTRLEEVDMTFFDEFNFE
ncbi:MAG: TRAP transporter TatT component family protein [Spirochaetes bacterium]|nr:TRAP transporter TatT component family protein [Spirochaetota bacterium]